MNAKHTQDLRRNVVLRKRLAKYMALQCFRNTELENLHAGKVPSSQSNDYSDVKVISPYGEIPWNDLSRISDEEMKILMIDVVNHCDQFLTILFTMRAGDELIEEIKNRDLVPKWNDPE